jgi:tetratricopeptide (TPR) repeat protein
VTGDAVNVAARLEQAAPTGEVLIGATTYGLVGDAAEVEAVEPLELKGKAKRVPAYRLVRVLEAPERRHEARFVGRVRELAVVGEAWEHARTEKHCELVTVMGDAGVGKSRLVAEFLASIEATVLRGRCLSYGEGITYWPVVEVLKQLDMVVEDDTAAAAIGSLLGETDATTSADEIAWAFRKTLEQAALERPLAVVFDDIQWSEETFLDLIEHVALLSSGAPILLIAIARRELSDRRPTWPVTLRLEPLGDEDVEQLIPAGVSAELREKIARAAGGNPLFVDEMLAMVQDVEGDVIVPPSLQALLAARLDQLEKAERSVLERGAIEGELFHRGAVQALAPEETLVTPRLAALVRKELIRPERSQLAGEDGFRFRHLLIRDAAYDALPKSTRAELHARFARWLEEHGTGLVELDEILGYHLEQACRYHAELGVPGDEELALGARSRLTAAGRRAHFRADYVAAASLLERALHLVPPNEIDLAAEVDLIESLYETGNLVRASERARAISERGAAAGDRVAELCGRIKEDFCRLHLEPEGATDRLAAVVEQALPVFELAEDDLALYIAYTARGWVANMRAQMDARLEAFDRAFGHARRAGLPHDFLGWRAGSRFFGTTPVPELLEWMDEQESGATRQAAVRRWRGAALAMLGRFDEARAIFAEVRAELGERGGELLLAAVMGHDCVDLELLAGDPAAAAELGAAGCTLFEELGEQALFSTAAGKLGQALYALDRLEEANAWAARAVELGASDDALTQMLWRQVRAKVLARSGEHAEAERLTREAVALGEQTDMLDAEAHSYADLSEALSLANKPAEAAKILEQALTRFERKGNVVMAGRTRGRLSALPV